MECRHVCVEIVGQPHQRYSGAAIAIRTRPGQPKCGEVATSGCAINVPGGLTYHTRAIAGQLNAIKSITTCSRHDETSRDSIVLKP